MAQGKNKDTASDYAAGSGAEKSVPLVGTGKFADNVSDAAKQWPTMGMDEKSCNCGIEFKRVSSGY